MKAQALLRSTLRWIRFNLAYWGDPPWDTGISPPELTEWIANHPAGQALDLGCGTGTNALRLAQAGWQVTGVDFAPQAVIAARRKAARAGVLVDFHVGDVTAFQSDSGYDLVLDMGCYHSLSSDARRRYRANLARLLKLGGTFLMYAHVRSMGEDSAIGVDERDLAAFRERFCLLKRQMGSERGQRPATWLWYAHLSGGEGAAR